MVNKQSMYRYFRLGEGQCARCRRLASAHALKLEVGWGVEGCRVVEEGRTGGGEEEADAQVDR